jgi:hypothetical protein
MVYPRFVRALFGVEELLDERPDEASIAADLDLAPIRDAVAALLPSEEVSSPVRAVLGGVAGGEQRQPARQPGHQQ